MPEQIDGIDAKILHLIQSNAALSVADIADKVGLSSSPCWRRIKRMEEIGIIKQRVTILDRYCSTPDERKLLYSAQSY